MKAHPAQHLREAVSHFPYRKKSIGEFLRNWIHPVVGLKSAFKLESSLKVEAAAVPVAIYLGTKRKIALWQWLVLMVPIFQVLMVELLNTGVEELVRDNHPKRSLHYQRAMDAASAAVMVSIGVAAVCAAFALLAPSPRRYLAMGDDGVARERVRLENKLQDLRSTTIPLGRNHFLIKTLQIRTAITEANLRVLDKVIANAASD